MTLDHKDLREVVAKAMWELRTFERLSLDVASTLVASVPILLELLHRVAKVHPMSEYCDDDGIVLWYLQPIKEPPFHVGTPSDSDWPWHRQPPMEQIVWSRLPILESNSVNKEN